MSDIVILDSDLLEHPDLEALGLGDAEVVRYHPSRSNVNLGEHERAYYFLSLSAGGLKYQSDLVLHNEYIAQWLLLVTSPAITWGLRDSLVGVQTPVRILTVDDMTDDEIREVIASVPKICSKKCLIYSRRSSAGKKTVASFWKEYCLPDWEFETCEGTEEVLRSKCAVIPRIVIMGSILQDFSIQKPDTLEVEPIFLFYPCDRNVQDSMDVERLWASVRSVLAERKWILPQQYGKFYVGSALYEGWAAEKGSKDFGQMKLVDGFVMWDSYGLPRIHEDYTSENIEKFLGQFHALRDIAAEFMTLHRRDI